MPRVITKKSTVPGKVPVTADLEIMNWQSILLIKNYTQNTAIMP